MTLLFLTFQLLKFLLDVFLFQREGDEAGAVVLTSPDEIVAQLCGILGTVDEQVAFFVNPCTVENLYVGKIDNGVVERSRHAEDVYGCASHLAHGGQCLEDEQDGD